MLEKNLARVYNKFKLHLYGQFLREPEDKSEDTLSMQEIVYLELINKGYVSKVQSQKDKREYHLRPMPKYRENYGSALEYINLVADRMKERFSAEEIEQFDQMLYTVATELMPEMHSLNTNQIER